MMPRCRAFPILLALVATTTLEAQDAKAIYQDGANAVNAKNWVLAAEALYTYRQLAAGTLAANPDLAGKVDGAIRYAEAVLGVALETREELEKHGKVTTVTVTTDGKLDGNPVVVNVSIPSSVAGSPVPLPPAPETKGANAGQRGAVAGKQLHRGGAGAMKAAGLVSETPEQRTARLTAERDDLSARIQAIDAQLDSLAKASGH